MIKTFMFIQKKAEMSMSEFKDYYENKHIPMLEKTLFAGPQRPTVYKRNYIEKEKEMLSQMFGMPAQPVDFDVITEMEYRDEAHFKQMSSIYQTHEAAKDVSDDEAKFIDKKVIRFYMVDEAGK